MKSAWILAIFALILVGIAGPLTMLHGAGEHASCPVATAVRLPCLSMGTIADHISTLQGLLSAIPASLVLVLSAALALAFFGTLLDRAIPRVPLRTLSDASGGTFLRSLLSLIRWQARLAHSPTT